MGILRGRRAPRLLGLAAGIAIALAQALCGASDQTAAPSPPLLTPATDATPLRIFVTADARGYIEPCGCEKGQFGGLPRRGTLFSAGRRPQDLAIDLGNFAAGQRPLDRLKLRYMLEGLEALRYDVLVPGEGEIALGEDFEKAAKALKGPVVLCANLLRARDGARVYEPWTVRALADGRRIAIIGFTSPFVAVPAAYRVSPVEPALREVLAALVGKADAFVVAAYLEGKPALDLAAAFPEVCLVLGGRVPKGSPEVLRRGGAPTMLAGERGQYVSWVDLAGDLQVQRGGQQWLGEEVPSASTMLALLGRFKAESKVLGAEMAREAATSFRAQGRAGSQACAECHSEEFKTWASSPHAHAMQTLRLKEEHRNAECLSCHLQDFPSLAENKDSAKLDEDGAVGCEACHGGGARHIAATREAGAKVPLRVLDRSAMTSCVRCHDAEHSKAFKVGPYWEKIRHGAVPRGGER